MVHRFVDDRATTLRMANITTGTVVREDDRWFYNSTIVDEDDLVDLQCYLLFGWMWVCFLRPEVAYFHIHPPQLTLP